MNRREFLKLSAATAVVATPIAAVLSKQSVPALEHLKQLLQFKPLQTVSTQGNVFALLHCAQSITMSMTGYPSHKSNLFKSTAGAAAFGVFGWFGAMSHNVNEAIPSAPELDLNIDEARALIVLLETMDQFANYVGPLEPHFAYGELNKAQYELAHVLHIQDHFPDLIV